MGAPAVEVRREQPVPWGPGAESAAAGARLRRVAELSPSSFSLAACSPVDITIIGNVTVDLVDGKKSLGGAVSYAGKRLVPCLPSWRLACRGPRLTSFAAAPP